MDSTHQMVYNGSQVYLVANYKHKTLNLDRMKIETQNSDKPQKPQLNILAVSGSWIDEVIKPTKSDCVAVMVEGFKYPTIGWYNRKFDEWVLEDKEVKGKVIKWYPLPNYR